jgi:hypothetical protein
VAVVTLVVGVSKEDVVWKQDGAGCNPEVGVPEEDVFGKHDGAGNNRAYRGSEEDVFQIQVGAKRIRNRRLPQECKPCGLVDENGVNSQSS